MSWKFLSIQHLNREQEVKESTGEINGQRSIRKGGNIGEGEEPDNGDELERQGELSNGKRKKKRRVEDREAHTRAKSQPIGTLASVPDAATKQKHDHGRLSSLTTSRGAFVSKSYVGATSFKVYNYEIGDWNVGQLFNKFQADTTSIVSSFLSYTPNIGLCQAGSDYDNSGLQDFIMDVTAGSALAKSLPDDTYNLVVSDIPTMPNSFVELEELNQLIHGKSSFQALQDLVYSIPLNTKARRYLYASVQGDSKYLPRYSHLPGKDERQLMIDVVDPVLQGTFDVFGMPRDLLEERRNLVKHTTERIDRCKSADFVGYDNCSRQLVLAECSTKTDTRKQWADRWKLSRAMRDTFDSSMKKYGERVRPHSRFSVFGIHMLGEKLTLLQMDFRNIYRLWQLAWVDVPTNQSEFELNFSSYVTGVLCFAKCVEMEVVCRDQQPMLSNREIITMSRLQHRFARTTPSPRNSLTPSSARRLSKEKASNQDN
ncbi:hypothetical protein BGX31_002013 [Mortierella sp. GBA43]|nr:hypothetical protein BGX31_002013 [Mortierella sp. GBA43]